MSEALWSEAELTAALGPPSAELGARVQGVSIDTRTLRPGDLFFAIKGEVHDGHDHVARAFEAGAAAAVIAKARGDGLAAHEPTFAVEDTLRALGRLGRAARARSPRPDRRGDRLGRQDQRQGNAARRAGQERADARLGGVLQQSLGRAADACAPARRRPLRGRRDRHEPRRRNHAARRDGAPARRAGHHDRAGSYRASRLDRGHRRRQGGNLLRPRTGAARRSSIATRRNLLGWSGPRARAARGCSASAPARKTTRVSSRRPSKTAKRACVRAQQRIVAVVEAQPPRIMPRMPTAEVAAITSRPTFASAT